MLAPLWTPRGSRWLGVLSLQTVPRQIFRPGASNRRGPLIDTAAFKRSTNTNARKAEGNSSLNGECPVCLTEIRADLVFLWYQLCWVQRGQIVIFSFVRALWQFDFLVVNLLVGNETQDV